MASTDQLLATKLHPPFLRAKRVARSRLLTRLDENRPLTLITAPAGFGKTTLLGGWILKNQNPVAWLSLDDEDNDPARFWSYVIAALQQLEPTIGDTAFGLLQSAQPTSITSILTQMINQIVALPQRIILVLDDYQVITAPPIHEALAFLLEHLPDQMRLMITTRADPPLPIARYRSQNKLTEIRAADLRFTFDEVVEFLKESLAAAISPEDIAALEARTEGWIVGLQLVVLSMEGSQDISGFLKAFTGNHRYIIDYLVEEVLARQPEPVQHFLIQTAILERLQGSLCEAVIGEPNEPGSGQVMLERLEKANLFLTPLDDERQWYRYHQLFAEALRHYLHRMRPAHVQILHQRASIWYEQHGLLHEAVRHALKATDFERAAHLMEQVGNSLVSQGEIATLQHWIAALPNEVVRSHVEISIWQGWLLFVSGNYDAAERHLEAIEDRFDINQAAAQRSLQQVGEIGLINQAEIFGRITAIRASIAIIRGDLPSTIALSRQALKHLARENMARAYVAWYLGKALWLSGSLESASSALASAVRVSWDVGHLYAVFLVTHDLAQLQISQGHLHQADQTYRQALREAPSHNGYQPALGPAYLGRANLEREWNHLDIASSLFQESIKLCEQTESTQLILQAYIGLAYTKQAQGDTEDASTMMQQALQLARGQPVPRPGSAYVEACGAWLSLMQGDDVTPLNWAQRSNLDIEQALNHVREREYLTLIRVLLRQSKAAEATKWLDKLAQLAELQGRLGSMIEILMLQAQAMQASGDSSQAMEHLARALSLAEPEGYARLFVDEGSAMARLLVQLGTGRGQFQNAHSEYQKQLLALLGNISDKGGSHSTASKLDPKTYPLDEPLSERELEVLRLIVAGYSNQEIADRLILAVSTVKWYINRIYEKLQVESRTKAIVRARELHLV